jgi:hypothetical protein
MGLQCRPRVGEASIMNVSGRCHRVILRPIGGVSVVLAPKEYFGGTLALAVAGITLVVGLMLILMGLLLSRRSV